MFRQLNNLLIPSLAALAVLGILLSCSTFSIAVQHGDLCDGRNASSCDSPDLTCNSSRSKCECSSGYFKDDRNSTHVICSKKIAYGAECPVGNFNPCNDIDNICISDVRGSNRCLCIRSFYRKEDQCRSLNELEVTKVTASSSTTTVTLTWSADNHGLNVTYTVRCNQNVGQLGSMSGSGAIWVSLTPGRKYSFNITSTLGADVDYPVKMIDVYKGDVWTEPSKPGQVLSVTIVPEDHTKYDVTFQAPPENHVAKYSLTINKETVISKGGSPTGEITNRFSTLKPGQNYSYSLIAYNGVDDASEASVGVIRINVTDPGVVKNLQVIQDEIEASSVTITFTCPDEAAQFGNIQGYNIQKIFYDGQKDEQTDNRFVVYNTTPCQHSYSADDVGGVIVGKTYIFQVRAWNQYYVGNFTPAVTLYVQPKAPNLLHFYTARQLMTVSTRSDTQVDVKLCAQCLLDSRQGEIRNVGLVICVKNNGFSCTDKASQDLDKYDTWAESQSSGFNSSYRVTPVNWKYLLTSRQEFAYTIGTDDCRSVPVYCNGPLPAKKSVIISVVKCNDVDCDAVSYDYVPPDDKDNQEVGIIVGVVFGSLVVICVIIAVVVYKIFRNRRNSRIPDFQDTGKYPPRTPLPNPPPAHHFVKEPDGGYIEPISSNGGYFTTPDRDLDSLDTYAEIYDYIDDNHVMSDNKTYLPSVHDGETGRSYNPGLNRRELDNFGFT